MYFVSWIPTAATASAEETRAGEVGKTAEQYMGCTVKARWFATESGSTKEGCVSVTA